MRYIGPSGPPHARVMVVGEAPGPYEEASGKPFDGPSGWLLDSMLREAGMLRSEVYVTNVLRFRPPANEVSEFVQRKAKCPGPGWVNFRGLWVVPFVPQHIAELEAEIRKVRPNVIIALGNLALWALTEEWGITSWRGSEMTGLHPNDVCPKVIPSVHPAAVLREMEWRHIVVTDLRRAHRESQWPGVCPADHDFIIRPSFRVAMEELRLAQARYDVVIDLETRYGHIACIGIATSKRHAISIPLMCQERPQGYWPLEEEQEIVLAIRKLGGVIGQNLLYDLQYTSRWWGWLPRIEADTMIMYHTLFPIGGKEEKESTKKQTLAEAKRLDYLASIFAEHYTFWKEEGRGWEIGQSEEDLWAYNCKDTVYTFEVYEALRALVEQQGMTEQVEFQHEVARRILPIMLRGVRWDSELAQQYSHEIAQAMKDRLGFLERVIGYKVNPRSTPQLRKLFYEVFHIRPVYDRTTARPTLKGEALAKVAEREPLTRPLVKAIEEYRSLGTVKSTFVDSEPDADGRMRCSYNVAGTETFRFSSSISAFGTGMNLQNVPTEEEAELYPNIRRLIQPDPDYVIMEWDLSRADLHVVAWEADDPTLKQMLRESIDIHTENAGLLGMSRPKAKSWTHATDYGLSPRTAARKFGLTVHHAETQQRRYFAAYPGIPKWHERVWSSLESHHAVWNAFGYRRFYFGRITPDLLPHALAWIPQSTVAITINKAWTMVDKNLPSVNVLLQSHDSFTAQVLKRLVKSTVPKIRKLSQVTIPYPDPLVIPIECKLSEVSWGDVK